MIFESETKLKRERSRRDNCFLVEISSGIQRVEEIREVNRKVRKNVKICQRRRLEMMEEKRTKMMCLRVYVDGVVSVCVYVSACVCVCMCLYGAADSPSQGRGDGGRMRQHDRKVIEFA